MPARCSLIIVNYRSASLAADAIRSARATARAQLQVIVVDNSVDPSEAEMLKEHADIVIAADRNLGYGAAINRARQRAQADAMIAANPDVRFGEGAIDRLLDTDADVAGPALYWDDAFEWILPPADLHTAGETVDAALASRSAKWRASRGRRRLQARIDFWSLQEPSPVKAISGAVMAIRMPAFDRIGGFDERFHLYFEEIDFLRRLGKGIVYVPPARCRHIYNQSAGRSPEAAAEYARSEERYLKKWSSLAAFAKRFERRVEPAAAAPMGVGGLDLDRDGVLLEASPLPSFNTAAGHFPRSRRVEIPHEVWESYRGETLYLRAIDLASRAVFATWAKTRIRA